VFIAVNEGMFPIPFADKPIEVLLFVQVKVAFETELLKFIAPELAPLQSDCVPKVVITGTGFMMMFFDKVPVHPFIVVAKAVIVYVPALLNENIALSPVAV
jgi:hypothetical protein